MKRKGVADVEEWIGLEDFLASMAYWERIERVCIDQGLAGDGALLFGPPYLDGERLIIPNGAGRAQDSEGYRIESIVLVNGIFTLQESGRDRSVDMSNAVKAYFGTFSDIGKYFIGFPVADGIRAALRPPLNPVNWKWADVYSPAIGWQDSREPDPSGFMPATRYFRADNPDRFYFTDSPDPSTSYPLNLSWRELNETYADGIPGIERVSMPRFSDERR